MRAIGILMLLALWPSFLAAEVKTKVGEDGIPFIYNESSQHRESRLSPTLRSIDRQELQELIVRHAERQRLSRRLVQAVIQVESGYNPSARSRKGAMGLMQLMPETAKELAVADPYDPEENVRGGTDYLRAMLDRFGDLQMALAAYNAGPTAVTRYQGIPPYRETQKYVERVLALLLDEPLDPSRENRGTRLRIESSRKASSPPAPKAKVFVRRGADDKIVMTTSPPNDRR